MIITGNEKVFAAGADIKEISMIHTPFDAHSFVIKILSVFNKIENLSKPVIAAVSGLALGGGCELSMACDIRIAAENAMFGQPEIKIGVIPGGGGTQRLPRLVGIGRAKELLYTGDPIDAREAFRIGLVNKVVPGASLMEEARIMAAKIIRQPGFALKITKMVINEGINMDHTSALSHEARCFESIQKHKATFPLWVPTMINALANHPDVDKYDLSSLKLIAYGASPVAPTLLRRAYEVFQCDFIQLYGMTEAAPIVTTLTPEDHKKALADPSEEGLLKAAGRQILGVEAKVVDIDGKEVSVGEVGEVIARGDTIMQGYWGKPIETEAALIDGWYWTKDLARRDENNYIYIVDRAKDMIISGAENVYSIEVEDALSKHPDVLETAVVGIPDAKWGETIKGVVVLKPGTAISEEKLIAFCKKQIASFKTPKSIDFIDALPKSGAGKILKRELRDVYWKDNDRGVH